MLPNPSPKNIGRSLSEIRKPDRSTASSRRLKNTGMSIQEIARCVQLTHEGDHTLAERVELLRAHREQVLARMAEMQKHLEKVTWKLNFFTEKLNAYEAEKAGKKETP